MSEGTYFGSDAGTIVIDNVIRRAYECLLCGKNFLTEKEIVAHHREKHHDYPPLSLDAQARFDALERQIAELTARLDKLERKSDG